MIFVLIIIVAAFFLLSTSGTAAEVSVLGLDTPVISNTPAAKEPEPYITPAQEVLQNQIAPVSTFLME